MNRNLGNYQGPISLPTPQEDSPVTREVWGLQHVCVQESNNTIRRFSEFALTVKSRTCRNHLSRSGDDGAFPLLSLGMVSRSLLWLL